MNKKTLIITITVSVILLSLACPVFAVKDKIDPPKPQKYQMLFFRNDGRVWIVIPPKTTMLEIYPSIGRKRGWVKAFNRWGEPLAIDYHFHGAVRLTNGVKRHSIKKGKLVAGTHDGIAVGIYTREDTHFIEVINAENGFDGVVNLRDWKKRRQATQSGIDLKITNYK